MSCNNKITVTDDMRDPFDNAYTYYNHYSNAFQNTFNNQISSSQKRLNGTNNCTPFSPLFADNNNKVPEANQYQKWTNQRDYGNICVQTYDPSNMVNSNCYPYNRLPQLSTPETSPADTNMAWSQNLDELYYN